MFFNSVFNKNIFLTTKTKYNNRTAFSYLNYAVFNPHKNLLASNKSLIILKFCLKNYQTFYLYGRNSNTAVISQYLYKYFNQYFLSPNWYTGWLDNYSALRQHLKITRPFVDLFFLKYKTNQWSLSQANALLYLDAPQSIKIENELARCRLLLFEDVLLQHFSNSYGFATKNAFFFFLNFYVLNFYKFYFLPKKQKRVSGLLGASGKTIFFVKNKKKKLFLYHW